MQLTRRAEYAIRAMFDVTLNAGERPIMSKEIAARQDIPVKFLNQIIPELKSAGLLYTVRGNRGGIGLSRSADAISVRQIVEAIEGPIALTLCLSASDGCVRADACPVHEMWQEAQEKMVTVLETTTLARLAGTAATDRPIPHQEERTRLGNEIEIEV